MFGLHGMTVVVRVIIGLESMVPTELHCLLLFYGRGDEIKDIVALLIGLRPMDCRL